MSTRGKSIRIYLADGNPTGIRHAEIVGWTGQALAVMRNRLGELRNWSEAAKPGIYFLFSQQDNLYKFQVYIGEAENVFERLLQHLDSKEFWNEAVLFTNKDENLTKSHVKYLESRLIDLANNSGRYQIENSNKPSIASLPRGDRDAMEDFIEGVRTLLGTLGHPILEAIFTKSTFEDQTNPILGREVYFNTPQFNAKGLLNDTGLVVLAGSTSNENMAQSIPLRAQKIREELQNEKAIIKENGNFIFKKPYQFSSPSLAAAVISGYSINGRVCWKDVTGISIKEIEEKI